MEISGNCSTAGSSGVALLAEGVDRNSGKLPAGCICCGVALLAEGVDRNMYSV